MRFVTAILADDLTFSENISDLAIVGSESGRVLISATYAGNGLASFAIPDADTPAQQRSLWEYPAFLSHGGDTGIKVIQHAGQQVVTLVGLGRGAQFRLPIRPDGSLGGLEALYPGTPLPFALVALGQLQIGGVRYLYAVPRGGIEFTLYREGTDGRLTAVDHSVMPLAATMPDAALEVMLPVVVEGRTIMISASGVGNFLASHLLDAQGHIQRGDFLKIGRGTGFNVPNDIDAVTVAGNVYLIMSSAVSSSITTVRVLANGSLIPVDHVIDELGTRFHRATALATVQVDGRAYVFVGGADGGISMFTVLPDGRLMHLETLADDRLMTLGNVSAIAAERMGDQIVLFVASLREAGITQLVVDLAPVGLTMLAGAGSVTGTAHDDMLLAGRGTTQIDGGAGDDVLISGTQGVVFWGGAGHDVFIPTPIVGRILIRDYDPGEDSLDLSQLGMIRSTLQLKIVPFAKGVRISFDQTVIELHSSNGGPISRDLFSELMFTIAHYIPPDVATLIVGSANDEVLRAAGGGSDLYGLAGNDALLGNSLQDLLDGGPGNDTISGALGDDTLIGGPGDDRLRGDDGDDAITGGAGQDMVLGDAGNDRIDGQEDNDSLSGGSGGDQLTGGSENDYLSGDEGNDSLQGNGGNDTLSGGDGNDLLQDDSGDNILSGGAGNDTLNGGPGRDRLGSGFGADLVEGAGGNDLIDAGTEDDTVRGGAGDDRIDGGGGDDLLFGEDGNDEISGALGRNRIFGGAGDDLLQGDLHDEILQGEDGDDTLFGQGSNDSLGGGDGDDLIFGGAGQDQILGGARNDLLFGGDGDDLLNGEAGADILQGGTGNDRLIGGADGDMLSGGAGADQFVFLSAADAPAADGDRILDFQTGEDLIDLAALALDFIGDQDFSAAGQLRLAVNADQSLLLADIDGDARADLLIRIDGPGRIAQDDLLL